MPEDLKRTAPITSPVASDPGGLALVLSTSFLPFLPIALLRPRACTLDATNGRYATLAPREYKSNRLS